MRMHTHIHIYIYIYIYLHLYINERIEIIEIAESQEVDFNHVSSWGHQIFKVIEIIEIQAFMVEKRKPHDLHA